MKKPDYSKFHLQKVKTNGNGSVAIDWQHEGEHGLVTFRQETHETEHPDFTEAMQSLAIHIGDLFGIKEEKILAVTGVKVSGVDENEGVVIMGKITPDAGIPMSLNTHRIKYDDQVYGFEGELAKKVERIKSEAYEYLFENKRAQLSMAFDDEKPE